MIYDLAHEFRELDVRRVAAAVTVAELREWRRYFDARSAPDKGWIRDGDQAAAMSAFYYG